MTHEARVRGLGMSVNEQGPDTPVVMLEVDDRVVPIFISTDQAQSIQHALEREPFERPLTHDLLVEMVGEFGSALDRVRIDGLADGTFLAKIDAEQYRDGERRKLTFDARPSDAIAIALRVDCPIEVSESVLDRAGRPSGEFDLQGEPD
ncbi:bifunctional nuclease family protein [Halobacteriales archaeon QS_5_70_15]|jgi:bifunctional DNase/RNase|nr:MAG: bifunctional nuclease family protein [Halobacteriales archaeon QS_5_70_15]